MNKWLLVSVYFILIMQCSCQYRTYRTIPFASLFEIKEAGNMGSGDLRPIFKGLYEEQRDNPDQVGNGKMTVSRTILVGMRNFLELFMKPRETDLWQRILDQCQSDYSEPQFVRFTWDLYLKALRQVNTSKDWNEMNPYFEPNKTSKKAEILKSAMKWDNKLFINTKKHIMRDYHALMVFNLYFCEKPELEHVHLCPDGCFGRINSETKEWELGNPCENVTNIQTERCYPIPEYWPEVIGRFWKQMGNPKEGLDDDHISGAFSWLTRNQGYQCDCQDGYKWNNEEMVCVKGQSTEKKCDPITLEPCSLKGTRTCSIDREMNKAACLCHPEYTGTFCERMKDPCTDLKFNMTLPDGRILSDATGETICRVDMDGIANEKENVVETKRTDGWQGPPITEVKTVPKHSRCVGKPGTNTFYCICKPPFSEDLSLKYPNCLHQEGSCDSKLCVHGACVTTPNHRGKAICLCYAGYVGPECNQREEEWSVWSSCKPMCGRFRSRTRSRLIPAHERGGTSTKIEQKETCPARMGKYCPQFFTESVSHGNTSQTKKAIKLIRLIETSNPDLLKLLSVSAACGLLLIAFIQILRLITFMLVL